MAKNKAGSILTHSASVGIGYLLGSRKTAFSYDGQVVSEVGDAKAATYPYYRIKGNTKSQISNLEFEQIINKNFDTPVILVNKTFLDKYKTV